MKYDISCSGNAIGKVETLETTLEIMARAGYRVIDFWMYVYSTGDNAPLARDDWREWTAYVRDYMEKLGIIPGQCHCKWEKGHSFSEAFTLEAPGEIYFRSIEACHLLGCRRLIFHPLFYLRRISDENTRMAILDANAEWFRRLLPAAERFDVELHLENTFDFRHIQQPGDPDFMFTTSREMLYLAKKLDHPLVKLCLDTGHANIARQDVPDMIRRLGPLLGSLHLNDNFGLIGPIYEDLHMFPGHGALDWDAILSALKEIGYTGTLNMEPGSPLRNGKNDDQVIKLSAAKALLGAMAARAGLEAR